MNRIGFKRTSEKLFWVSLVIYCLAFAGFYFTTQHTFNRINYEEQSGAFLKFKEVLCQNDKACTDITFRNIQPINSPYYRTHVDVIAKQGISEQDLQRNYHTFIELLPWYIGMQFDKALVIDQLNNQPYKANQ